MTESTYTYRFSVFTATKNRSEMLYRLYGELLNQTYSDFEWVIVNDGSTDDTDKVAQRIISEAKLNVQYVNKQGGGKHTAWRAATPLFKGRYVVTADDDDPVTNDMLEVFNKHWTILESRSDYDQFWEVKTRCKRTDGTLVGKPFSQDIIDSDYISMSYKHHVFCEMVGCRKVEVLRNEAKVPDVFPFQNYASNFDEAIRWCRAARRYKTRFVSDITRIYIETPNSLSSNILIRCLDGDKRITSNKMVELYYTILERRDILLKHDIKRYFKTIFGYSLLIELSEDKKEAVTGLPESQRIILFIASPVAKLVVLFYKLWRHK